MVTGMKDWPVLTFAADAPALIATDTQLSWRALHDRVILRAKQLEVPSKPPHVFIHARNSIELVVEILACQQRGWIPVLCNPRHPEKIAQDLFRGVQQDWHSLPYLPDDVADIMFTSGSTGAPKAVVHTHAAQRVSAEGANLHLPFGPGMRWLVSLSLCHVGGLGILERALVGGGALVIPEPNETLWDACQRFSVTHLSLVRTQLGDFLGDESRIAALENCDAILLGGGPCPANILQQALSKKLRIAQTWGLTETCAQVCTSDLGSPETCGRPLPHRRVKRLPDGRLAVAGPVLASGYLIPGALSLPMDEEGFFITQDRGEIDGDGRITIAGRADLVFDSGGENIQPEHIENILLQHPDIEDAMIVPVPHPKWGQRPFAFVFTKTDLNPQNIRDFLSERLPRFSIPDVIHPWPASETRIKASRQRLRQIAIERYASSSSSGTN